MANSTLKCRYCGKREPREEVLKLNGGNYCDIECATAYGREKGLKATQKLERQKLREAKAKQKAFDAETRKLKREEREKSLKVRREAAKTACHAYIRERDKNERCICCGKPLGVDYHAGHFYTDGNHPYLRYDEDNIHAQRLDCNFFHGGDSGQYRERLINKIGEERVRWLDENKSKNIKRTADDLKRIEQYYKDKLKSLKGE